MAGHECRSREKDYLRSGDNTLSKNTRYFVSQKILASVFQGTFIAGLRKFHKQKKISYQSDFERLIVEALANNWVVHCKPPFSGPVEVIKYLARYTRKVAISNSRLVSLENGIVSFNFNDYSDCYQKRLLLQNGQYYLPGLWIDLP